MQADVEGGAMSVGHAKALLAGREPRAAPPLRDRIVRDALSVRQPKNSRAISARRRARRHAPASPRSTPISRTWSTCCASACKTQVRLRGSASRGRIEIDYVGADELNRLVELVLGAP